MDGSVHILAVLLVDLLKKNFIWVLTLLESLLLAEFLNSLITAHSSHVSLSFCLVHDWYAFPVPSQGSCLQSEERLSLQINLSARGDRPADLDKLKPYVIEHILFLLVAPTAGQAALGECLSVASMVQYLEGNPREAYTYSELWYSVFNPTLLTIKCTNSIPNSCNTE